MKRLPCVLLLAAIAACHDSTAPNQGPNATLSDLGSMNVGDVRVLTFAQAQNGLTIPSNLSTAVYDVIVANVAGNTDVIPTYTVKGDWQAPTASGVTATVATPFGAPTYTDIGGARGAQFEAMLRNSERSLLSAASQASGVRKSLQVPSPSLANIPANIAVGTQVTLNVITSTSSSGSTLCSTARSTTGTVQAVSTRAIIIADNNNPPGFTSADYNSIATEFDNQIYPTDVSYFGTPTDFDNNGKIVIYYTVAVNQLTPAGAASTTGYVGGFFFAGDLLSSGCAAANHNEIFYVLAPDPNAVYGNSFSVNFVRQLTRGTVAHEFQHMINSGNRIKNNIANFEATWLDEALAHFAEEAVGRVEAGFGDLQPIALADVNAMDSNLRSAFFLQNFARAKYYVLRPDTTAAIVSDARAGNNIASRGAEWALVRYAADWFSNDNPRQLTQKLVSGPDTGTANLVKQTGASLDTLLAHWLVTLDTDHRSITNLPAQYNYRSLDFRQLISNTGIGIAGTYLPVTAIGTGNASINVGVPSSSADYFSTTQTNGGARTIRVTGAGGAAATDSQGRIYIVRVQ